MNSASYYDWWHYSGTGLGVAFPGEKLEQLRQELSAAGANVVSVGEFLEQNPGVLDVGRWRRAHVYGPGGEQVRLTAEALEAIGARGAAAAVRAADTAQPRSPTLSDLKEGAAGVQGTVQQMLDNLRERMAATRPELTASWPEEMRRQVPHPQQTKGTETRDEVLRLLADYVTAHREELAADVARYGDPRQAPDFDPQRFLEEQARQSKRLFLLRDQREEVPRLREKLEALKRQIDAEPPDTLPVQRERQRVMEEYRRYAKYQPEDRTPEVQAWLAEVERLREQHPQVFRPPATRNEQVNAKLTAIGDYRASFDGDWRTVSWSRPQGLECDWTRFTLGFCVYLGQKGADLAQIDAAYERLLTDWERFRARFPELEPQLKGYVPDFFRQYRADELDDDERGRYEDEQGEIADDKILASIEGATVNLVIGHAGDPELTVHFDVPWDEEHGVEVQFDEGEIVQ